eukprot:1719044-Pyramimonas_sp.AAC.1
MSITRALFGSVRIFLRTVIQCDPPDGPRQKERSTHVRAMPSHPFYPVLTFLLIRGSRASLFRSKPSGPRTALIDRGGKAEGGAS